MNDVYYNPEKFNLVKVWEDEFGASYEFDIQCVWRHKETGQLYTAQDSGCSCPSPFEDYTSVEALSAVDMAGLRKVLEGRYKEPELSEVMSRIEAALETER